MALTWVGAVCAGSIVALPSHGQLAALMGSISGSYCKVKKNDMISVNTTLSLDHSESFARQMTLRRLASLARSKGFSAIVVTDEACGTLLLNGSMRSRSCKIEAHMENSTAAGPGGPDPTRWYSVDQILADTQADAPLYPQVTGLMNRGNKCVID